ncbi:MAG: hypothetical protein H0X42_06635 [Solirubrobacterales bacterium]|nr:hypothetical protein [Solirubrobacterales bacterium]
MRDRDRQPQARPADEDALVEGAVLAFLVAEHPIRPTLAELIRELTGGRDFAERDSVERAVRDLTAVGLVHRQDCFVWPTRAALRFARVRR